MKNTVIFGGTFNPPHIAHEQILNIITKKGFDEVLLIPTALPPHKTGDFLADDKHRLNMCKILAEDKNVTVSDMEIIRGGKSYTIDTLNAIRNQNADNKITLVCGGDMIIGFHKWYRFTDILQIADLFAVRRENIDNKEFDKAVQNLRNMGAEITVAENSVTGISSTDIRKNFGNSEFLQKYLPQKVYNYIKQNNLYGV